MVNHGRNGMKFRESKNNGDTIDMDNGRKSEIGPSELRTMTVGEIMRILKGRMESEPDREFHFDGDSHTLESQPRREL